MLCYTCEIWHATSSCGPFTDNFPLVQTFCSSSQQCSQDFGSAKEITLGNWPPVARPPGCHTKRFFLLISFCGPKPLAPMSLSHGVVLGSTSLRRTGCCRITLPKPSVPSPSSTRPLRGLDGSVGARLLEGVLQLTSSSSSFSQWLTEEDEKAEPSECSQLRTFGLLLGLAMEERLRQTTDPLIQDAGELTGGQRGCLARTQTRSCSGAWETLEHRSVSCHSRLCLQ